MFQYKFFGILYIFYIYLFIFTISYKFIAYGQLRPLTSLVAMSTLSFPSPQISSHFHIHIFLFRFKNYQD